ncbi:putative hydrolase of the HAD superfamily [Paenibacillus endophyticus]|uniref:Putative hydrolase of the HAD superfamily n=1 Tax=Paenibacillus endophyticus TaxID=1294268 RepID=A0A7W5C6U4_9BACL|nr:haloacid dehalogenase [Paenibacillus endophyticus]MBB3152017.1 putative hydrolase of the HAD superfamily [Paenibacillus endophyticus]
MTKPQLVLDIGGVLATNLSPLLWQLLAIEAAVSEEHLYSAYKREISESLWRGHLSEEQFWEWIISHVPTLNKVQGRAFVDMSLKPLPALAYIPEWQQLADIHILSNHLSAWVDPLLSTIRPFLNTITISSQIALKKPDPSIFESVISLLPLGSPVLFVDDQQTNLKQAVSHGWRTLLADDEGHWMNQVSMQLKQISHNQQQ